ncbi:hypothetical protein IHE45_08G056600 [Dioscorea alata]|uniref:Uncharacterized protein n=1 Tax=Dioscorea alata TaxID=55571 RepID=A0ACB7VJG7_DIOAL|nr:hypothetical protein IHE45_08G056600 [Dioscorea alata]
MDPAMREPCDFCWFHPTFLEYSMCSVCGYPNSTSRWMDECLNPLAPRLYCFEIPAEITLPPSNSSLAKRMIDVEDMNDAASTESEITMLWEPDAKIGSPPSITSPAERIIDSDDMNDDASSSKSSVVQGTQAEHQKGFQQEPCFPTNNSASASSTACASPSDEIMNSLAL